MHEVHDELAKYYEQHHQNPLKQVAQNLAKNRTVLCLDDLWVSDITDAMILGQLFEALKNAGLTFVITSNVPINQLYEDGLQRARFLPTIQLLNQMTDTLVVDQGKDYRRFAYGSRALLFVGKNAATDLYHRYKELTHQEQLSGDSILCQNRPMAVLDHSRLTLLIDFKTLCVEARSTTDYIELTNRFEFIAITHLPLLSDDDLDPVRRFIAFVDESYDRKTYLAVAALCDPWDAYQGSRLAREWQRTQSRLHEILSDKWLNRP
jgi:cell division protein ZapE